MAQMQTTDATDALASMPAVLTVGEAAEVLRIPRTSMYRHARNGDIPSIRVGHSVRIRRSTVEALLAEEEDGAKTRR